MQRTVPSEKTKEEGANKGKKKEKEVHLHHLKIQAMFVRGCCSALALLFSLKAGDQWRGRALTTWGLKVTRTPAAVSCAITVIAMGLLLAPAQKTVDYEWNNVQMPPPTEAGCSCSTETDRLHSLQSLSLNMCVCVCITKRTTYFTNH